MQRILEFKDSRILTYLTQEKARLIDILEKELSINVKLLGNHIILIGKEENIKNIEIACQVLSNLNQKIIKDNLTDFIDIKDWLKSNILRKDNKIMEKIAPELTIKTKKRHISPRSAKQADYIKMINDKELTFGLGPAGTGKTYLAVAKAVEMMINGEVDKIILTRPAVEAGENLGFLPGDLKEKIDPYLRPLYDALYDMLPADTVDKKIEFQEIEIAPLLICAAELFLMRQ
jgi:phosphate starvation-inducible PhoH-like protein